MAGTQDSIGITAGQRKDAPAPSSFVRKEPGGSLYNEPAQSTADGKSAAEYNRAHGRAPESPTSGGQVRRSSKGVAVPPGAKAK